MVFMQSRGFIAGEFFGWSRESLRSRHLVGYTAITFAGLAAGNGVGKISFDSESLASFTAVT